MYYKALESNLALRTKYPHDREQIDFSSKHLPHITLFLSDFALEEEKEEKTNAPKINSTRREEFLQTVQQTIYRTAQLQTMRSFYAVLRPDPIVNGLYAMWELSLSSSLQYLSNILVEATQPFVKPNQKIPEWIYDLPYSSPHRKRKIDYIRRYGSPNVFEEFEPHLTVGYDEVLEDVEDRSDILEALGGWDEKNGEECGWIMSWLGVGVVGDFGGVVLGKEEDSWLVLDLRNDYGNYEKERQ